MTLGVSNVSRIHFGFKFIVNPDPDPIIEYAIRHNVLIIVWVSCCDVSVKQKAEFKLVVGDLFYCCLNIWRILPSVPWFGFSALTLLVGWQDGHPAFKSWVVRYWRGYLSGARCNWFAYGQADGTAAPSSLVSVKSRLVYLSGAGLPRLSWKKGR